MAPKIKILLSSGTLSRARDHLSRPCRDFSWQTIILSIIDRPWNQKSQIFLTVHAIAHFLNRGTMFIDHLMVWLKFPQLYVDFFISKSMISCTMARLWHKKSPFCSAVAHILGQGTMFSRLSHGLAHICSALSSFNRQTYHFMHNGKAMAPKITI